MDITILLPLTLIKKFNTIHCVLENDRINLELDFGHSYFLHRFDFEEWDKFVNGVDRADRRLKEIKEGDK